MEKTIERKRETSLTPLVHVAMALALIAISPTTIASELDTATTKSNNVDVRSSIIFIKTIYALTLDLPITPEKITANFGWAISKQTIEASGRYTYFNVYPNASWNNPLLTEKITGNTTMNIGLRDSQLCIPSEDVLAEFGNKFKPATAHFEGESAHKNVSEVVKRNIRLFLYGPIYEIASKTKVLVNFKFLLSECLEGVSVQYSAN